MDKGGGEGTGVSAAAAKGHSIPVAPIERGAAALFGTGRGGAVVVHHCHH